MEFNNRRERKRFETEWAKLRQEYHNAGMSEDAIQSLYLFDFSVFKRSRSIAAWEEPFENESEDGESKEQPFRPCGCSDLPCTNRFFR